MGTTNLAVTIYCVPLRLHRQGNIWVGLGGGIRGFHGKFSLKIGGFYGNLAQN